MFESCDAEYFRKHLVSQKDWKPCPSLSDRDWWKRASEREENRALIKRAGELLGKTYPSLRASDYIRFLRGDGNRSVYEDIYFERRRDLIELAVAEAMENRGRYLSSIMDLVWLICEETSWCVPAHNFSLRGPLPLPEDDEPVIDLFSAETASLLAYVIYLFKDQWKEITPQVAERGEREIARRIIHPFYRRNDFWWMGLLKDNDHVINNWNPWILSNVLSVILLCEGSDEKRALLTAKAVGCLEKFVEVYPQDGGCDEGPGYWNRAGASLFDCLEFLYEATRGELNRFDDGLIKNIGAFIYRTFINEDYYVNFADAPARVNLEPAQVVAFGERTGDDDLIALGRYGEGLRRRRESPSTRPSFFRWIRHGETDFSGCDEARPPRVLSSLLPDIQVVTARSLDSGPEGLFFALKGGHNGESHNHNDVGQIILYVDGAPFLIDVGVGTYTRKTFSPRRYEIWTMQSAYHNLPTINGIQQAPGKEFRAEGIDFQDDRGYVKASLSIGAAYPEEAGVVSWVREVLFDRVKETLSLTDAYVLSRMNGGGLTWSFMFAREPEIHGTNLIFREGMILECPDDVRMEKEEIPIDRNDMKMRQSWDHNLWRVTLTLDEPNARGKGRFLFRRN